MTYTMNTKQKGTRTLYFATINGKRLSKTLWARRYDAVNEVKRAVAHYGIEKLQKMAA